jgi:hypothetical protein
VYCNKSVCSLFGITFEGTTHNAIAYRPRQESKEQHSGQRSQHHRPASILVDNVGTPESPAHVPHRQTAVDDGLVLSVCYANPTENDSQIVASQGCTGGLRCNGTCHDDPGTVTITLRPDEVQPATSAVFFLEGQGGLDFVELE